METSFTTDVISSVKTQWAFNNCASFNFFH